MWNGWFPVFCELNKIFQWRHPQTELSSDKRLNNIKPRSVACYHHERKTVRHFYPKCYINAAICYLTFCWETTHLKSCYFLKRCSCWQWSVAVPMWPMPSFHNRFQDASFPTNYWQNKEAELKAVGFQLLMYVFCQQTLNAKEEARNNDFTQAVISKRLDLSSLIRCLSMQERCKFTEINLNTENLLHAKDKDLLTFPF